MSGWDGYQDDDARQTKRWTRTVELKDEMGTFDMPDDARRLYEDPQRPRAKSRAEANRIADYILANSEIGTRSRGPWTDTSPGGLSVPSMDWQAAQMARRGFAPVEYPEPAPRSMWTVGADGQTVMTRVVRGLYWSRDDEPGVLFRGTYIEAIGAALMRALMSEVAGHTGRARAATTLQQDASALDDLADDSPIDIVAAKLGVSVKTARLRIRPLLSSGFLTERAETSARGGKPRLLYSVARDDAQGAQ